MLRNTANLSMTGPNPSSMMVSQGHPQPKTTFLGSERYGGRHMNDRAPFSLWNEENQTFVFPSSPLREWIRKQFKANIINVQQPFLIIRTDSPPTPMQLTVACMPAIFITTGEPHIPELFGSTYFANPRLRDPCPNVSRPQLSDPSKSQMSEVLGTLSRLMRFRSVLFLPIINVVELEV